MCTEDGCEDTAYSGGLCIKHYRRMRRKGHTELRQPLTLEGARSRLFDNPVEQPGPLSTPCWIWPCGPKVRYPMLMVDGKVRKVHRIAAHFMLGLDLDDPTDLTLHECDIKHCYRHLYLGNGKDNGRDARERSVWHPNAKLTEDEVADIRRRRHAGERGIDLAVEYGVTPPTISALYTERTYRKLRNGT